MSEWRQRQDEVAGAFFSLWVVSGLFLDGWAHHSGEVESFWTPWHAVLYAGFAAATAYAVVTGWLARRAGEPVLRDRLVALGFLAFFVGGVGDGVWHSVFGVEEDLEALLSPTHLLLMGGGLLLTTSALRAAWARPERAPSLRTLLPAIVGTTLALAITGFFLQFSAPFASHADTFHGAPDDTAVGLGVMGMLVTTVLLLGATYLLRARWQTPAATFLIVYGGFALMMSGLHGFAQVQLVLPAAVAGSLADGLVRGGASARVIGALVPAVLWTAWFATYGALWGVDWTPELWAGAIVFASLAGLALSYVAHPPVALGAASGVAFAASAEERVIADEVRRMSGVAAD